MYILPAVGYIGGFLDPQEKNYFKEYTSNAYATLEILFLLISQILTYNMFFSSERKNIEILLNTVRSN